ncbi:MAG: hypothetical protein SGCHY_001218 [Lobulomycetales sp.]
MTNEPKLQISKVPDQAALEAPDDASPALEPFFYLQVPEPKHLQTLMHSSNKKFSIPPWIKRVKKTGPGKSLHFLVSPAEGVTLSQVSSFYNVPDSEISTILLPAHQPQSRDVCVAWSATYWPMIFRPSQPSRDPIAMEKELTPLAALINTPAYAACTESQSVIASPDGLVIVSACSSSLHPLAHEIMECIGKIAQIRKDDAANSSSYLCKDLDLWTWTEPCVMCAMALLHSRVSRVFIREKRPQGGGGAFSSPYLVHGKRGLNHRYNVYHISCKEE